MTVTRLARAAFIVAVFGLVSRFLGLAREMVMSRFLGATADTDAYVNALLVVNIGAAILLYALVTVVIPVFSVEREGHGEASAWRLVWAIAAWVGMGLIVVTAVITLLPGLATAPFSMAPQTDAVARDLVRIMAPALLLQGISALFTALLQLHDRFGVPAALGVVFNAGVIAGMVAGQGSLGIAAAAWGVTAGAALQVLLQLPQFIRVSRSRRTRPSLAHPRLGMVMAAAIPVMGASMLQQVNNFTDKYFASSLEAGRNTALYYANSLGAAPRTALLIPFLTPLFPLVARLIAQGRDADAVRGIHRIAGLLGLVGVPAMLLLVFYAHDTTQLLMGHGKCGEGQCVSQITPPLAWYAVAILGNFLSIFFNRVLAAANQQRDVLWATVWSVAVTVAFDAILIGPMQQAGLAAASAIGVYLNLVLYAWFLRRRFPALQVRRLVLQQLRLLACGVAVVAVALAINRFGPEYSRHWLTLLPVLAAKCALAATAYVLVARLVAPAELREARDAVRALVRRRRPAAAT